MTDDNILDKVYRLIGLIDGAYDHYFATSDGHCKMAEGEITLTFGNYFDRHPASGEERHPQIGVGVYSYVFGEGRQKYFYSVDDALDAAEDWLIEELNTDRDPDDPADWF